LWITRGVRYLGEHSQDTKRREQLTPFYIHLPSRLGKYRMAICMGCDSVEIIFQRESFYFTRHPTH
jgi:hypothetical protein